MSPIENWFSTPVYYNYADAEAVKQIDDEYRAHEADIVSTLSPYTWGDNIRTTFKDRNLIEQYGLKTLEALIVHCTKEFVSREGGRLHQSWVNYSDKYSFQGVHHHFLGGVSGVYYLQTNQEDGMLLLHHLVPLVSDTPISYKPEVGKIILFPGWAPHSVEVNKTDSTRISISFNVTWGPQA
jgi:hypothetical protein